jgi:hypothetical protein
MIEGQLLNIMAARRWENESGEQQPYEYTDVSNYDLLVAHINVLYASPVDCKVIFKTGMYRRADKMVTMKNYDITSDDVIYPFILGRDGGQDSNTHLGKWLCVGWEGGSSNIAVVQITGVGR